MSNTKCKVDDKVINAKSLNKHFCEISPNLNATVPVFKDISFNEFLISNQINCTLNYFDEIFYEKIKSYIMSSRKAITDLLLLQIIEAIFPIIAHSITHIVNLSLLTGQFSDSCKLAIETPIFSLPQSSFSFYKKALKEGWKRSWFVGFRVYYLYAYCKI